MALLETFETPAGVEYVRDVEHEELNTGDEIIRLFRTGAPVEVQVGETLGNPVYTEAEYFLVIDVDHTEVISEEDAQMMSMMGMHTEAGEVHHDLVVVVISNEDGEIGAGVEEIEGGNVQDALELLSSF